MTSELTPRASRAQRRNTVLSALCLAAPLLGLLWVPWYAGGGPALAGVPFFYWYQFAWVPVSALLLLAAYRLRRADPPRTDPPRTDPPGPTLTRGGTP
ncbi:DUF3311 domain-containing protein [Actinoplanes sp. ATCC 53533]|uniref:DUF3311 domain-containing protein n=1 Tax=Actinoplanes sp. ATCC 53533 TaxID=1288362 RepID=UPI0018F7C68D|nr:DUF3311 domain-containing protein [Actinoplanes sp. ATCC 53533]